MTSSHDPEVHETPDLGLLKIISTPNHGILQTDQLNGVTTYIPAPGYAGTDTFHYTIFDGFADSTPTLVTINVLVPPL